MDISTRHDLPALDPSADPLRDAIARATHALFALQQPGGYWWAELESNVTITAEVMLLHCVWGTFDRVPRARAERYLRGEQRAHGGWDLAYGDGGELSVTIEAYLALRMLGVERDDPALVRARAFVLARGGVARARVFTKMHLALMGAYPWAQLPAIPPWLMLLPGRGPFSIYDLSSWARGSTVPLTIVFDRKPVYGALACDELWAGEPGGEDGVPARDPLGTAFRALDAALRWSEARGIVPFRARGLRAAERWILERQEPTGDWGGIIPAMLNSMLALRALGYDRDDPAVRRGWAAIDAFTIGEGAAYRVQPCISPVWDTALAVRALTDAGVPPDDARLRDAARWLAERQIVHVYGDWAVKNRAARPGGWAFEFDNAWYPDVDDSAMVVMALAAVEHDDRARMRGAISLGAAWTASMQCKNGGWAAFDVDNDKAWLNRHPYGDLGAMIDPSTADVTARVLEMAVRAGVPLGGDRYERGLRYLLAEQEPDGAWFGRWGVNYVYGTSGALAALGPARAGRRIDEAVIRGAVWLKAVQNDDGGWGETTASYRDPALRGRGPSTASQTAWGLIGLLACAERLPQISAHLRPAIERGIARLLRTQRPDGTWDEPEFTGTGFPQHFFLNYHQYRLHFPLSALGRWAALRARAQP